MVYLTHPPTSESRTTGIAAMSQNHPATPTRTKSKRTARRPSLTRPAPLPLRFEALEDRSVPSFSFPLTGGFWGEFGPRNIAIQPSQAGQPGQGTSSPGNLASSGRIAQVAPDPTDFKTFYAASAGGGVWKTTDSGTTWT